MKPSPMPTSRLRSSTRVWGSCRKLCFSSQLVPIRGSMQSWKFFSLGNSCVWGGAVRVVPPFTRARADVRCPTYAGTYVVPISMGQVEKLLLSNLGISLPSSWHLDIAA